MDEKPLSGRQINDMIAIDDGDHYVMQTWDLDPANPGQPIHVVDGREVIASFGEEYGPGDDISDFDPLETRYLAATSDGTIMAARRREYRIEAWSREGQLLGSLAGPDLGNTPFEIRPDHTGESIPERSVDHTRRRLRAGCGCSWRCDARTGWRTRWRALTAA